MCEPRLPLLGRMCHCASCKRILVLNPVQKNCCGQPDYYCRSLRNELETRAIYNEHRMIGLKVGDIRTRANLFCEVLNRLCEAIHSHQQHFGASLILSAMSDIPCQCIMHASAGIAFDLQT